MPTAKHRRPTVEHSQITLRVKDFSIHAGGGINYEIHDHRYAFDETRVYKFDNSIEIVSDCTWPEERIKDEFRVHIRGQDTGIFDFESTLSEHHVTDKNGCPKYRKRGKYEIPVYDPPDSIGMIEKVRGESVWQVNAWLPQSVTSDLQRLVTTCPNVYIEIHEVKTGKRRALRSIQLSSKDPDSE